MATCEWCGHPHEVTALCTQRPKWSRRGFLSLVGLGAVGLAVGGIPTALPPVPVAAGVNFGEAHWVTLHFRTHVVPVLDALGANAVGGEEWAVGEWEWSEPRKRLFPKP